MRSVTVQCDRCWNVLGHVETDTEPGQATVQEMMDRFADHFEGKCQGASVSITRMSSAPFLTAVYRGAIH